MLNYVQYQDEKNLRMWPYGQIIELSTLIPGLSREAFLLLPTLQWNTDFLLRPGGVLVKMVWIYSVISVGDFSFFPLLPLEGDEEGILCIRGNKLNSAVITFYLLLYLGWMQPLTLPVMQFGAVWLWLLSVIPIISIPADKITPYFTIHFLVNALLIWNLRTVNDWNCVTRVSAYLPLLL